MKRFLAAILAASFAAPAAASTTITFSGALDGGFGAFQAGDPFDGSFTYDEAATARSGSSGITAVFDALSNLSVTIHTAGGPSIFGSSGPGELQVGNKGSNGVDIESADRFALVSQVSGGTIAGDSVISFALRMEDSTGSPFSTALSLPTSLDLSDFDVGQVAFAATGSSNPSSGTFGGSLATLSPTAPSAVPEPATWAMMLVGFGVIGAAARRRQARTMA